MDPVTSTAQPRVLRRLIKSVKAYWWLFLFAVMGNMVYAAVDSYAAYLFKPIINQGFIDQDQAFMHRLPWIVLGLFLARGVGSFVSTYCIGWIGRRVVYQFRLAMFDKILRLPAAYFKRVPSGQLLSKLTYNVEQVTFATGDTLTTLVRESCFVFGLLVVMFYTSWRLSLVIFTIMPFLVVIVQYVSKRFRKLSERIQEAMGDVTHIAEETIAGFDHIRIYAGQQQQARLFSKVSLYNFIQEMKIIMTNALSTPLIQFLGACVLALIIYIVFEKGVPMLSAGDFIAMLTAMLAILKPIKKLSQVNATLQRGLAGASSIFELLDESEEAETGAAEAQHAGGEIVFDEVCFCYDEQNDRVLKEISLTVASGERVAFVGRSGSGKSTLMQLLCRFYQPMRGRILIDGQDIATLSLADCRAQIALVSQEVTLFDESIRYNLTYGCNRDVTDEQVQAALQAAHVDEFLDDLPDGLETRVGERGYSLSGGQRQRIAIARALLKDAPILILDEATSALDNTSEKAVQEALEALMAEKTTLVIAHRLSTIESADRIVVMDQGAIVEMGTHAELMAVEGGVYFAFQSS